VSGAKIPGASESTGLAAPAGVIGGGSGGVAGVRYAKSPSTERLASAVKPASPSVTAEIEAAVRSVPSEAWLVIVLVLAPALFVGVLFGDRLAPAARDRWRYRFMRRPPWA
jgi:hypothetical protein